MLSRKFSKSLAKVAKFVWIDCEMTGLDIQTDLIMEVACVLTNSNLEPCSEGFQRVIQIPEEKLKTMNEWCRNTHGATGLTEACRNSKITLVDAEAQLKEYIQQNSKGEILYLAGNSIYMDRMFLDKYMPAVTNLLHYRMLDVTSLKILCGAWYPDEAQSMPPKNLLHRSLDDIHESIRELKYYREKIFR